MINIRYNILVGINILTGILNAILLIRLFGVSALSDAWLLSVSILTTIQVALPAPISQFLAFYNDYKAQSVKKSHEFYCINLLFALIYGFVVCIILNIALDILVKFFAFNIDIDRLLILKKILRISICGLCLYPVNFINENLLNAQMKFSVPYILSFMPGFCVVCLQILLMIKHSQQIYILAYGQAFAYILISIVGTVYINQTIIKYKFVYKFNNFKQYVKNSVAMKISNGLYTFCLPTILNNFLVSLPTGNVSYFYYAQKIINIVNTISTGPSSRILYAKISKMFSQKCTDEIKKIQIQFLKLLVPVFLGIVFVAYFAQVPILTFVSNAKLNSYDLQQIQYVFLSLVPWNLFLLIESPFVYVNIFNKKSRILLFINIMFISTFSVLLVLFAKHLVLYAIGAAAIVAQFFNFLWHRKFANSILAKL